MRYIESRGFYPNMDENMPEIDRINDLQSSEVINDYEKLNNEGIVVVDVASLGKASNFLNTGKKWLGGGFGWTKEKTTKVAVPVAFASALVLSACGGAGGYDEDKPDYTSTTTSALTETVTQSPTPTETATPTPTEVPEPEGARGNVESIDQLNIPEAQKEAIDRMLKDADARPQIIIELKRGSKSQVVIIALQNEEIKLAASGERTCPVIVGSGAMEPCPGLTSIEANEAGFTDVYESIIDGVLEAKLQAYKVQSSDSSMDFKQLLEQIDQRDFSFKLRAQNIFTGATDKVEVNEESPYVFIFRNSPYDERWQGGHSMAWANATLSHFVGNGVIGQEVYMKDGFGVGGNPLAGSKVHPSEFAFAERFAGMLSQLANRADLTVVGDGTSTQSDTPVSVTEAITPHFFKMTENGQYDISDHWPTVFITAGVDVKD